MDQWKQLISSLSRRQQISLIAAAVLVAAALAGFSYWRKERDYKPLFTGMGAEDAGAIVEKLKESGADYRVGENGAAVLVPSGRVAELRLQMAAVGLPKTGRIGFELFDKTNLGATDFTEQVNYRRALEGELERTIKSVIEVEQARVHITFPKDSVFLESRLPAKASVLLKVQPGVRLTPSNVNAIAHLVSSAVEGLAPEAVSVLDVHGNLLSKPNRTQEIDGASDELIEYRQQLERDLLAKINSTLEPVLGAGRYRAGVSVECDFTSGEQSEETYDPERSVMLTSQKSEEMSTSATAGGIPGTASNLPRPPVRTGGTGPSIAKRTENITYQSSKTVRRLKLPQGGIKRLSASVLMDQGIRWDLKGNAYEKTFVPPGAEQVRAIRELVSATIGFVPGRGDQLVVESLPFETTMKTPPPPLPPPAAAPPASNAPGFLPHLPVDWRILAGIGAGLVLLLAAGFVIWKRRRKKKVTATAAPALPGAEQQHRLELEDDESAGQLTEGLSSHAESLGVAQTARIEQLLVAIRTQISEDPDLAASVLRTWMEEKRS